jgi:hypothetical protein
LPQSLWQRAKIRATMERVPFTEIVRRALKEYLAKGGGEAARQRKK